MWQYKWRHLVANIGMHHLVTKFNLVAKFLVIWQSQAVRQCNLPCQYWTFTFIHTFTFIFLCWLKNCNQHLCVFFSPHTSTVRCCCCSCRECTFWCWDLPTLYPLFTHSLSSQEQQLSVTAAATSVQS